MPREVWTDDEIVRRLRADDLRALDVLIDRLYRPLLNFVLDYVDGPDAADDVLQELFIWVWERRAQLQPSTTLTAYLYAAARHRALNAKERQVTRGRYEATGAVSRHVLSTTAPVGSDRIEEAELLQALHRALATLSPRSREVYVLGMRHGMTYREIAATLGISVPTAQTHMTRALKALEVVLRPFLVLAVLLTR